MYKGTPSDANTSNPRENGWVKKVGFLVDLLHTYSEVYILALRQPPLDFFRPRPRQGGHPLSCDKA